MGFLGRSGKFQQIGEFPGEKEAQGDDDGSRNEPANEEQAGLV